MSVFDVNSIKDEIHTLGGGGGGGGGGLRIYITSKTVMEQKAM